VHAFIQVTKFAKQICEESVTTFQNTNRLDCFTINTIHQILINIYGKSFNTILPKHKCVLRDLKSGREVNSYLNESIWNEDLINTAFVVIWNREEISIVPFKIIIDNHATFELQAGHI